ncbi:MAG: 5'/3'-nucleotidase SurE [Alphaproteobacteria bacterium]|nr:5'/3'-nucleotidase SurE [Alphaproteobacteria bacterium]
MRILLTNDDGIHAPGLKVLEKIARTLSDDVWIVAPEHEQSGSSHSLTLHEPLRIREVSDRKYAVSGTPTDCVLLAVYHIMKNNLPGLVLSGVNNGGNIAEDVTYSGTIAGAIEGTLLGIPSISLSMVTLRPHPAKWATAEHYGEIVLKNLAGQIGSIPSNVLININFPDMIVSSIKGIKVTTQGHRQSQDFIVEGIDPRGRPYFWVGPGNHRYQNCEGTSAVGTDLDALMNGYVSVTPLSLNLTDAPTVDMLKGVFAG